MSVADPLTFTVHHNSFKKMTSLTEYHGEKEENSAVECALLDKLKKMAITENHEVICEDKEKAAEKEIDNELIERGPTSSRRRQRVNPYPSTSESPPSSCSDSSQGSPLNYNSDKCYSSGGSVVINKTSSFESLNGEDSLPSPESTPNRHIYMHKNGGQVHLVNQTNTTPTASNLYNNDSIESHQVSNGITSELHMLDSMRSSPYPNRPRDLEMTSRDECGMSDTLINSPSPFSVSSNTSSIDYISPSSPDVLRNETMLYQMENFSLSRQKFKSESELSNSNEHFSLLNNDDMPEDVKEFIVDKTNFSATGKLKNEEYFEVVEGILKIIDKDHTPSNCDSLQQTSEHLRYPQEHVKCMKYNNMCQKSSPLEFYDNPKQSLINEDCIQDTLIPSTVEQVNKSPAITNKIKTSPKEIQTPPLCRYNLIPMNNSYNICSGSTFIIMPSEQYRPACAAHNPRKKLRDLAPKPEPPKVNTVQAPSNSDCRKITLPDVSKEKGIQALRASILSKFTDDQRRNKHCHITKIPDENIIQKFEDGDTLLHMSSVNDILSSVYLIDRFSKLSALDVKNVAGETPLLNAIIFQQYDLVNYLLCQGANPNCLILKNSCTVLHYVAQRGTSYLKFLELLCQHPQIKLDAFNSDGKTPLMSAIESHGKEVVLNDQRRIIDSERTVELLLKYKASVVLGDRKSGKTAFHFAVQKKSLSLLKILCSLTKDVKVAINVAMFDGNTPLHLMCSMNDCEISLRTAFINLMLRNGASKTIENVGKKIPSELVDKHCKEVRRLFSPLQP